MFSPAMPQTKLIRRMTKSGVEVDICPQSGGIWLDQGELFLLAKKPQLMEQLFHKYYEQTSEQGRICPRSGVPMQICSLHNIARFEQSPTNGGLWFDAEEWQKLLKWSPLLDFELCEDILIEPEQQKTAPLPSLGLHTVKLLVLLNAFFLGTGWLAGYTFNLDIPLHILILLDILICLVSFLASPWIIDATVAYFYKSKLNAFDDLPPHLRHFIDRLAQHHNMARPALHLILDGAPQAFTYGHTPDTARIVLSTGLLKILGEKELEAVCAHEMGHAKHWDIALMSWVELYPLVFYQLFRMTIPRPSEDRSAYAGGISAFFFLLYVLSEYLALGLSRVRELHADRFAATAQQNGHYLSSALIKIGYGLIHGSSESAPSTDKPHSVKQFEALNIMGINSAGSLMVPRLSNDLPHSPDELKQVMKWDLWNPWARWYELSSTHPLIARRLQHLGNCSKAMGQKPYVDFNLKKPESYWDDFAIDFSIYLLPWIGLFCVPLGQILWQFVNLSISMTSTNWLEILKAIDLAHTVHVPAAFLTCAIGLAIKAYVRYPLGHYVKSAIASLLKTVKVSNVRPVPCTIRGRIIGKGNPGSFFSDDFYIQDETGMMYLSHRTPLSIMEFFFGFILAKRYIGKEVEIIGWYRRAPVPYIEVKELRCLDESEAPIKTSVWAWSYALPGLIALISLYFWNIG
ncbi:M48 family metalloprotease [Terasakiella sp. SH-1]|uniref:M48 family metalloprotease n=1 Tax=Terasakiella sp. SH-1 TaxID=2560057 RepID=UPI0010746C58|nr:M48 family metalloprotease [Terasakiella sp. SH-1]